MLESGIAAMVNAMQPEMMPQVTKIRAIHRLAPSLRSNRLLGTSNMK